MSEVICSFEGCDTVCDTEALTLTHKGKSVGAICPDCLRGVRRLRLFLALTDAGIFKLKESTIFDNSPFTR